MQSRLSIFCAGRDREQWRRQAGKRLTTQMQSTEPVTEYWWYTPPSRVGLIRHLKALLTGPNEDLMLPLSNTNAGDAMTVMHGMVLAALTAYFGFWELRPGGSQRNTDVSQKAKMVLRRKYT